MKVDLMVIGANVLVEGSTTGTITDFDGNYSIEADGAAVLVFSYIGMQNQEMAAKDANGKTITLKEDSELLEEVVVVGFGAQKKESLTGSVAVVSGKLFEDKGSLSSPLEAMQGQVAGVIDDPSDDMPLGDAVLPLLIIASLFSAFTYLRRRRQKHSS